MAEHNQRFDSYQQWVNKASSWLTRRVGKAICFDAKGRQCRIGQDFMRARDEGTFPIRWIWDWQVGQALITLERSLGRLDPASQPEGAALAMRDEVQP